jgi:hypothetical protein
MKVIKKVFGLALTIGIAPFIVSQVFLDGESHPALAAVSVVAAFMGSLIFNDFSGYRMKLKWDQDNEFCVVSDSWFYFAIGLIANLGVSVLCG